MGALKRIVTRESLFQSTFTAHAPPARCCSRPLFRAMSKASS